MKHTKYLKQQRGTGEKQSQQLYWDTFSEHNQEQPAAQTVANVHESAPK